MVKTARSYRSEVRTEQARRTRERIVQTARQRFIESGYAPVSIVSIAEAAGVAPETIYDVFGTKRRLLEEVVRFTIAGADDEAGDFLDRPWVSELKKLGKIEDRVAGLADHTAATIARMAPLHALIRAAAASDRSLSDLPAAMHDARFATQRRILAALASDDEPRLARSAAETFSALASPELHHLMVVVRGWSQERYARWLRDTVVAAVLRSC